MQKFSIPLEVQREDRIFGPITMRRLIILCIGGGLTYVLYLWLLPYGGTVWVPPVLLGSLITLALAFLELFGMRFEKLLLRFLEFILLPRKRVWDKRYSENVFFHFIEYKASLKQPEKITDSSLETMWKEKEEKLNTIIHPLSL